MLLGNKIDNEGSRQVQTKEAEAFAEKYDIPFSEISWKSGEVR